MGRTIHTIKKSKKGELYLQIIKDFKRERIFIYYKRIIKSGGIFS